MKSARGLFPILGLVLLILSLDGVPLLAQSDAPARYIVKTGTRVPLVLVNSVSTKTSHEGDQVYLQTSFPIIVDGRIIIPEGSYVTGTITQVKRPGRVKGRGDMYIRFDVLSLPNGVQRDFRGTVSAVDGDRDATLKSNDKEGKIEGEATKGEDAETVGSIAATGAGLGSVAGIGSRSTVKGLGIGAGVGAAIGMGAVLLTRGPDLRLPRGSSLEMQLDRELSFAQDETNFLGSARPPRLPDPPAAQGSSNRDSRGWPKSFPSASPF